MLSQKRLQVPTGRSAVSTLDESSVEDLTRGFHDGFEKVVCPTCRGSQRMGVEICPNCEGGGHLWSSRGATLSDAGLRRLLSMSH